MPIEKNAHGLYEAVVDGVRYEFSKWGANDALETLLDISEVCGGPLSALFAPAVAQGGSLVLAEVKADLLEAVMKQLFDSLQQKRPAVMRVLVRLSSHKVMVEGRAVVFDVHYQGNLLAIFRVARAALEVQFGDFFATLGRVVGVAPAKPSAPPPPSASAT